jgi:steroid 5-alpha reductase family enzyme
VKRSIIGILISLTAATVLAVLGSDGSVSVGSVPLFALCGAVAFAIHWIVFVPSYIYRTEHYFDLTGSVTYLSVVFVALLGNANRDPRSIVIGVLVVVWAIRLGSFLFRRVKRAGKDDRFDRLKHDFLAFLMTWTLSGLWVFLTAAAALAAMTSAESKPWGVIGFVGLGIWILGFSIEVIADNQKSKFCANPENAGRFISGGIWAWSRHPNYFGEIVLWTGIAVVAFPALLGWQYATLISPVFVWLLLTRVSGIPMLEAKAEEKWGDDPEYKAYRDATPILVLRPPKKRFS